MRQEKLAGGRIVDYAVDGTVVGVEFLEPSRGLHLGGLPRAPEIARAAAYGHFGRDDLDLPWERA